MINLINISKKIKNRWILKDISLTLPSKGIVILKGENGSGKTTLLNIISLLDDSYKGTLIFDDCNINKLHDLKKSSIRKNEISYCFQKHNFLSFLNYDDNKDLDLVLENKKVEKTNKKISNLSQGEQQLLALNNFLKPGKKLYILDEILNSLDKNNRENILEKIIELANESLVIIVSHDKNLEDIACKIIKLENGEIVSEEDKQTLALDNKELVLDKTSDKFLPRLYFKNLKTKGILHAFVFLICLLISNFALSGFIPLSFKASDYISFEPSILNQIMIDDVDMGQELNDKFDVESIELIEGTYENKYKPAYIKIDESITDNKAHVSKEMYNQMKTRLNSNNAEDEEIIEPSEVYKLSFVYQGIKYSNIEIVEDDEQSFSAFYINPNNLKNQELYEILSIPYGYWDTYSHKGSYYYIDEEMIDGGRPLYSPLLYVSEKYALEVMNLNLPSNILDDSFYIFNSSLRNDEITYFSKIPNFEENKNQYYDLPKLFSNGIKIELIDDLNQEQDLSKLMNYVVISNNNFKKIYESKSPFTRCLVNIDGQEEKILNYLVDKGINISIYEYVYSVSDESLIMDSLSNEVKPIAFAKSDSGRQTYQYFIVGGLLTLIFLTIIVFSFNGSLTLRDNYLLKKMGFSKIYRYLFFDLSLILTFLLSYFSSYLLYIMTYVNPDKGFGGLMPYFNFNHIILFLSILCFMLLVSGLTFLWRERCSKNSI